MSEKAAPEYLYKYKGIQTIEDMDRAVDIIKNNRIYIPTRTQLNDPLECKYIPQMTFAIAGNWITSSAQRVSYIVESIMDKYRILSLSSDGKNLQMWAHYANNYSGICIEFKNTGEFEQAQSVKYTSEPPDFKTLFELDPPEIDKWVRESYFIKSMGWSYESEYRIIKSESEKYLQISDNGIVSVTIGHKLPKNCMDYIYKICKEKSISVYVTWPSDFDYKMHYVDIRAFLCEVNLTGEDIYNYEKGKDYDRSKLEELSTIGE